MLPNGRARNGLLTRYASDTLGASSCAAQWFATLHEACAIVVVAILEDKRVG